MPGRIMDSWLEFKYFLTLEIKSRHLRTNCIVSWESTRRLTMILKQIVMTLLINNSLFSVWYWKYSLFKVLVILYSTATVASLNCMDFVVIGNGSLLKSPLERYIAKGSSWSVRTKLTLKLQEYSTKNPIIPNKCCIIVSSKTGCFNILDKG